MLDELVQGQDIKSSFIQTIVKLLYHAILLLGKGCIISANPSTTVVKAYLFFDFDGIFALFFEFWVGIEDKVHVLSLIDQEANRL